MFRIVCFVDNKRLGDVLEALSGKVHNMETPQHVTNVVKNNRGKLIQANPGGNTSEQLAHSILKLGKGAKITTKQMKEMITKLGGVPSGTYIRYLVDNKVIKSTGERGYYTVLEQKG